MKRMRAVESDSVKSARKAKDKLHKACKRASEIHEQNLHRQEQNNAHGKHESRDSLVSTQVQSHALMRRGFGTSVPFIQVGLIATLRASLLTSFQPPLGEDSINVHPCLFTWSVLYMPSATPPPSSNLCTVNF